MTLLNNVVTCAAVLLSGVLSHNTVMRALYSIAFITPAPIWRGSDFFLRIILRNTKHIINCAGLILKIQEGVVLRM